MEEIEEPPGIHRVANAPSLYRIEPVMPSRHLGETKVLPG